MGIDSNRLLLDIENLAYSGIVLSVEQRAALQTSLSIVREQYKFNKIYFWGKILGTKEDYFIAVGVGRNEIKNRSFLYSHDCIRWKLLNPPVDEHFEKLKIVKGRFTGDPSHEFECKTYKVVGQGEEEHLEEDITLLKEEDRLAAVVRTIESEALVVPRSAYVLQPTGEVVRNRLFEGLSVNESAKFCNYFHFRDPIVLEKKSPLFRANLDKAIDFLDPIDEDQPNGCWSLQFERGSALTLLRSLKWPGASFFHIPETSSYGFSYFGIGEENRDIPFML
ncbi:unnamed protein product [Brachionus calyciflorus]|uniref:Radial spoke head protein 9 homolog n=1 Tax=Brachionus calyciflorus TaxID=104777 RepID=A0A813QGM6_9BILA|nr:unnamed protein product [Brachionus calyciflorus]